MLRPPTLWSAEDPYLYTLVITTPDEVITTGWASARSR